MARSGLSLMPALCGALCGALCVLTVACSGGGPTPPPPQLAGLQIASDPQGDPAHLLLRFDLADADSRDLEVRAEVRSAPSAPWRPARASGAVLDGPVASTPTPTTWQIRWNALADLGFRSTQAAEVRVLATAAGGGAAAIVRADAPPDSDGRRRQRAVHGVRDPLLHYGPVDDTTLELCRRHDVVVLHPNNADLDRATVAAIQQGFDPHDPGDDVLVLGYVSVGEDLRTLDVDDTTLATAPRFVGDGSGPRVDPRGPDADGSRLTGLDPLGAPSPAGTGYASYYLDDNSVDRDPNDRGDGIPDRNAIFGGCFVNAGAPEWFEVMQSMSLDGTDGVAGLREVLTTDYGRGLGCDGLFLDTIDTCAPNYYTDENSPNQSEFEWTAAGFTDFMARLRAAYPTAVILQNRGLFFYDPRQPHFEVAPRTWVDYVKFESFRLDSSTQHEFHEYFYPDNRYNVAPKLCAEAQRPDGFTVLSLGYAEGPPESMSHAALLGTSQVGFDSLLTDLRICEDLHGFRHYLTDAGVVLANDFALQHRTRSDTTPPVWSSTWNANQHPWPTPPDPPEPRIGIQRADPGDGEIVVHWDVALDRSEVGYACYLQTSPFDFVVDPELRGARRLVLEPQLGAGYATSHGPGQVAFQARVPDLSNGVTYWLCIRAFDAAGNEERNEVFLTAEPFQPLPFSIDGLFDDWRGVPVAVADPADVPDSAGPDWLDIQLGQDAEFLYVRAQSENAFNLDGQPSYPFSRTLVMIDADGDPNSGYAPGTYGSELMVNGATLYAQDAGVYNGGALQSLLVLPTTNITDWEFAVPRDALDTAAGGSATRIRLTFVNDEVHDHAPDGGGVAFDLEAR